MKNVNAAIRQTARDSGVSHWQIADALGVSEGWLCRRLRHELPESEQARILEIIETIAKEREGSKC